MKNQNRTSILFTGDIGFDRYMEGAWRDEALLCEKVLDFFHSADHVLANVEGAVYDARDDGSRGSFFHCMNPEATALLKKIGADLWCIGNNHIMDAGVEGLLSTKKIAASLGFQTIGAGLNLDEAAEAIYLEEAGGIGIFSVTYQAECPPAKENKPGVFPWTNTEKIAQCIREIKKNCRWCIVVSHGGEEFSDLPLPYTRDRYLNFLSLGADVVVGHHPHVPENYECFPDGKAIFYSLGNFIFDTDYQRVHPYTDRGVLLRLQFTPEEMCFQAIGTRLDRKARRILASPLPGIFTNVPEEEYRRWIPLAAAVFLEEEKKKMCFLKPKRFQNATPQVWNDYFFSTEPDGYDPGAHMDLAKIVPLAEEARHKAFQESNLEAVKDHLLRKERPLLS